VTEDVVGGEITIHCLLLRRLTHNILGLGMRSRQAFKFPARYAGKRCLNYGTIPKAKTNNLKKKFAPQKAQLQQ
jgi:hypothetical protein